MNTPVQIRPALSMSSSSWQGRPRRLLQNHDTLFSRAQLSTSIVLSVIVLLLSTYFTSGQLKPADHYLALVVGLTMASIYEWRGVYRRYNGLLAGCLRIGRAWLFTVALIFIAVTVAHEGFEFPDRAVLNWALVGYLTQVGVYISFHRLSRCLKSSTQPVRRALVVGSGPLAIQLIEGVNRNSWIPEKVVGIVDDEESYEKSADLVSVPRFGGMAEIEWVIAKYRIGRVYIALPICQPQSVENIYKALAGATIDIVWIPDIFSMQLLNHSVRELNGLPLITLSETPLACRSYALMKAVMDKTIALLMLIALSPLMLVVSLLVWFSSPGPIIFKQKRHGWDGRIIEIWKFRSMRVHDDQRVQQARKGDKRVTAIGRFIRRTSIDELPQLFNVLQGGMSLVGPRPHAIEHNHIYAQQIPAYMLRHRIKPGITGLAQVNGYRGETEKLEKMWRRVEFDIQYINNWSIWLDLMILLKTPLSLFNRNAY